MTLKKIDDTAPAVEVRHQELLTNPTAGARLGPGPSLEEAFDATDPV